MREYPELRDSHGNELPDFDERANKFFWASPFRSIMLVEEGIHINPYHTDVVAQYANHNKHLL